MLANLAPREYLGSLKLGRAARREAGRAALAMGERPLLMWTDVQVSPGFRKAQLNAIDFSTEHSSIEALDTDLLNIFPDIAERREMGVER